MSESFFQNLDPIVLKTRFSVADHELDMMRSFGVEAVKHLDRFIEDMYTWMPTLREFRTFFPNDAMIPHVKAQQKAYWRLFFYGRIDQDYVKNRTNIGFTHARINLPINTYCVGMNFSIEWWLTRLSEFENKGQDLGLLAQVFRKMCSIDIALITESYSQMMNDKIKGLFDETNAVLEKVTLVAEAIALGDFSQGYKSIGEQDKRVSVAINQMSDNLKEVVKQTKIIAQGKYDVEFTPLSEKDEMTKALREMTKALREMSNDNKKSSWIKTGQAELSDIMRGDQDIRELGKNVISFLAKYIGALIGTIYQVDPTQERVLEIIGSFAYNRRKGDRSKIKFGEGLVGQCVLEKEIIVFSDVPDDYSSINSSLGEITPRNILIAPLLIEKEIIGVLELGTHEILDNTKMELVRQVSENIAISIKSCQNSEKMKVLLTESKRQSEELQAQQEELRSANEELQSQQQMLQENNQELARQATILKESEENIKQKNDELKEKTRFLEKQSSDIQEKSHLIEKAKAELEARAKELELASKYKSEFLANMSHELRTPLNSLLILSKSLADNDDGNLSKDQVESASVIHRGGKDLLNLINDILDLSKVEAGKLQIHIEDVPVQSIVENLKRQFLPIASSKGIQFIQKISEDVHGHIHTDAQRTEQILKNFLSNAFKFTQRGSVTIQVHTPQATTRFRLAELNSQNCIGISVIDTGIGIPRDKLEVIFEAFQQGDGATNRKYGGTGLGLSISRELSKLLHGEIQVQSEVGLGTTFTLYLPVRHEVAKKKVIAQTPYTPQVRPEIESPSKETTLLIVEDDNEFAKILAEHAQMRGYRPLIANTAKEALELAKSYKPAGITLDLKLPDSQGRQLLEELKSDVQTSHIPVHVVSGDDNVLLSLQKGAVGHLTKPANQTDIVQAFAKIEQVHKKEIKNVLLVEDSLGEQKAIRKLIKDDKITVSLASTGEMALDQLLTINFDCVILDLQLPDMSGLDLLRKISKIPAFRLPPVIIYTSRNLTKEEVQELHEYTTSFVIKGVSSSERLLDELFIFLHRIRPQPKLELPPISTPSEPVDLEGSKKILLVDDDMRNTFALSFTLRKKGFQVVIADNGKAAIDKLEAETGIDIVLMDIMMPIMDGYEAMRQIRMQKKFANLPIIALTAKVLPEDKTKAIDSGANDFLTKPVDLDKLLSLIKIWLSQTAAVS